jgi:DNA-binding transcriptional LysR family regulator
MTKLDVRLVRGFVAVADERSFTRAAERLHVAQPWLSVQIRKLEEQVGFRLFERNRNQAVLLSTQAEALLPFARDYLAAAERMEGSARRICDSATMTLRLGAPDFSAEMPMRTAIVDQFTVAHPELELEVSNAWTVELLKRVRDGELDAAFTVGPHVDASTEAMVVARYRLALLGSANDLVGLPPKPLLSALAGRTVATFRRSVNAPFHDAIVPALEAAGVTVAYLTESGHSAIVHNTLRTGMLALVGDYVATTGLPEPLQIIPLDDPALSFNLNLVRRVGDRSSAVSALWVQAMHAIARS